MLPLMPLANMVYSFRESNLSGKMIVLILFVGSIFVWTVMVTKYMELSKALYASRRFLLAFRKETQPLALFLRRMRFSGSPLHQVYEKGCLSLGVEVEPVGTPPDELFVGDTPSATWPAST